MNVDGEIIFVNDASPDDAEQVLRELAARDERRGRHQSLTQLRVASSLHERHARGDR